MSPHQQHHRPCGQRWGAHDNQLCDDLSDLHWYNPDNREIQDTAPGLTDLRYAVYTLTVAASTIWGALAWMWIR